MPNSTFIVVDLGFGDAGKGTMVDAIARRCSSPPLVVRHNGGAQAGHNVVTSDGRQHVFSQFGAATFVPGARTLLSKHFILHPGGLMAEHEHLVSVGVTDALSRLSVDYRALVITPYHQAMNRLCEYARGVARHGTCGLGVGEAVADSLRAGEDALCADDLLHVEVLRWKLFCIRRRKLAQAAQLLDELDAIGFSRESEADAVTLYDSEVLERTVDAFEAIGAHLRIVYANDADAQIRDTEHVIFEGAQGVLLDERHGFHPHTTWSTTTTANADRMIAETDRLGPVHRIGVVRAYATRHGQGPFPSENHWLTEQLRDSHNTDTGWQGRFRCGWFDVPLTRYALSVCPVDSLAVTCMDRLAAVSAWSICEGYREPIELVSGRGDLERQAQLTQNLLKVTPVLRAVPGDAARYLATISNRLELPASVTSFGPRAEDKRWIR